MFWKTRNEESDDQMMERIEVMETRRLQAKHIGDIGDYEEYGKELESLTRLCACRDECLYRELIVHSDMFGYYGKKLREMETWIEIS